MCGHPTRNAFALVPPDSRLLNDHTYGCMVTRKRPVHQGSQEHEKSKSNQYRWFVVFASIRIDLGQAIGRYRRGNTKCRACDCTGIENLPFHEALSRVRSGSELERAQIA